MNQDIIIAGVGGQGILSIAAVLGRAVLKCGYHLKQSEVHGMAQRGGAVQANLRISDSRIYSDVIALGTADLIVSMEPLESLRYLPLLAGSGWIVSSDVPFENISNYPELTSILEEIRKYDNHVLFDAKKLAEYEGSARAVNMAVLGAASEFIQLPVESIEESIHEQFSHKGESVIEKNIAVFRAARSISEKLSEL